MTYSDFRLATESKKALKAAADGVAGMILAFAEVSGTPEFCELNHNKIDVE